MLHLETKTKNFYNALAFAKGAFRGQLTQLYVNLNSWFMQ